MAVTHIKFVFVIIRRILEVLFFHILQVKQDLKVMSIVSSTHVDAHQRQDVVSIDAGFGNRI